MKYSKIDYLNDYLIVTSLSNFNKVANEGFFDSLKDQVTKSAPHDMKSLTNFLAPAVIYQIITGLTGARWIGIAIGLLSSVFNVDFSSIIGKICSQIKSLVLSGTKLTEDSVSDIIDSNMPKMQKEAMFKQARSFSDAEKTALESLFGNLQKSYSKYSIFQKLISALWAFLRFFFVTSLTAGRFLLAGSAIKALMPGSKDSTSPEEKPIDLPKARQAPGKTKSEDKPTQLEEEHRGEWVINQSANETNIKNFVERCVKRYYPNIKDSDLEKSITFKAVIQHIVQHNRSIYGWRMFFIPSNYRTEKSIADKIKQDI